MTQEKLNKILERSSKLGRILTTTAEPKTTKATSYITVTCPVHGEIPNKRISSLSQGYGCTHCKDDVEQISRKKRFIDTGTALYETQFTYDKVEFKKGKVHVTITCKDHGDMTLDYRTHTRPDSKGGCNKCALEITGKEQTKSIVDYIAEANLIHRNKYDYSKAVYINNKTKLEIVCPLHGSFLQRADRHISTSKSGCPSCATYGFDPSKPGMLYYLSINHGQAYKIGITNNSVEKRYDNSDLININIIKVWEYAIGG